MKTERKNPVHPSKGEWVHRRTGGLENPTITEAPPVLLTVHRRTGGLEIQAAITEDSQADRFTAAQAA